MYINHFGVEPLNHFKVELFSSFLFYGYLLPETNKYVMLCYVMLHPISAPALANPESDHFSEIRPNLLQPNF